MRIDIITINLNNKEGLERTFDSVFSQTFFDIINYIVIDGGSTDGSKELIEQNKEKLKYWCSEPDNGIFNAFNKGIEHIEGDYVLFLNSGDYLHNNKIIENVMEYLDGTDIVYGNEYMVYYSNRPMVSYTKIVPLHRFEQKYPDTLDENFFKNSALPHQSTFIKASLQKQHKYNESCVIAGDWTLLREAVMEQGATYKHIPFVISDYGLDGISSRMFSVFVNEKNEYYKNKNK